MPINTKATPLCTLRGHHVVKRNSQTSNCSACGEVLTLKDIAFAISKLISRPSKKTKK